MDPARRIRLLRALGRGESAFADRVPRTTRSVAVIRPLHNLMAAVSLALAVHTFSAVRASADAAEVELFNGKDLTGWGYKSGEKFDGKAESDDKRFSAK